MRNTLMHPSVMASAGAAVVLVAVTAAWPQLWPAWIAWLVLAIVAVSQARQSAARR